MEKKSHEIFIHSFVKACGNGGGRLFSPHNLLVWEQDFVYLAPLSMEMRVIGNRLG